MDNSWRILAPDLVSTKSGEDQYCPPPKHWSNGESYYTPAVYTSGAAGDVAVNTVSSNASFGQELVASVVAQLGGSTYVHTKILRSPPAGYAVGSYFTETYPEANPPTSYQTGEPNICSVVISPFYLARLAPGANTYYEDAQPGVLVKNFGSATCTVQADGYHVGSVLQDGIPGGTCEKELVDYCGVPVEYNKYPTAGDRAFFTATQGFNALNAAWNGVNNECLQETNLSWLQSEVCDGLSNSLACERAAWQVVNEVLWPAYPMQYWGLEGCNRNGCGYAAGWSDFNTPGPPPVWGISSNPPPNYNTWTGSMMGAGKMNGQTYLTPSAAAPTNAPLVPGACDDGSCNNSPINWGGAPNEPAWAPWSRPGSVDGYALSDLRVIRS
jgi:hypothetical protein